MAETLVPYFVAGTLLFCFWAYGVVSFVLDVKNKFIPAGIQLYRNRQQKKQDQEEEKQRTEREKQLY